MQFSVLNLKDGEIDLKLLTNVLSPETEVFEVGHNGHVYTLLVVRHNVEVASVALQKKQ